jgi:transcription elongation factor SPT6
MLSRARESLNALLSTSAKQSKYSPEVAKAVLERCPRGKYASVLEVSEFMTEEHFNDVHHFVRLLASGAQAAAAARSKADREERRRNPLSAADAELQHQGGYSGDGANADEPDGLTRAGIRRLKSVSAEGYATACKIPGLREFARSFVNDVHALGDGLMYGMNFKQDVPEPYDDVATHCKNYIEACGGLVGTPRSQEALQRHARALMAAEVAAEPRVRQHMRDTYMANASLSTTPTAKGVDTISAFHDLFGLHMLKDKPLSQFRNTEGGPLLFVKLMRAQKEGLISVTIDVPQISLDDGETIDDLDIFLNYATSGGYSMRQIWLPTGSSGAVAKEWDSVRDRILREALSAHLLPAFKKEFTRELTRKGKEAIIDEAALNYRKLVTVGPYRLRAADPAKETRQFLLNKLEALSIVAVNLPQSSQEDASISAIDRSGKVIKSDLIPARSIKAKQLRERIKEFIKLMSPMVIVINSSSGRMGRSMKNTIERNMVPQIVEEKRADARRLRNAQQDAMDTAEFDDDDDDFFDYKPDVVLVKDDVARVFAMSRRAASLFPDMEPGQAQAACLARFIQEPLAEYCNMWSTCDGCQNFGFETLFLDLHPQQVRTRHHTLTLCASLYRVLLPCVPSLLCYCPCVPLFS